MTRDEAKRIVMIISCTYPNFKPPDLSMVVDIWAEMLKDYQFEQVGTALKTYIATDTSGFAPSIGHITSLIYNMEKKEELNPNEAWALVFKALCNSTYNSRQEFEALPELVQKAVGSPDILRNMASDMNFNEGVEKSLFIKTYTNICRRAEEDAKIPSSIKALIGQTQNNLLEVNNG